MNYCVAFIKDNNQKEPYNPMCVCFSSKHIIQISLLNY